jgi:hypothetical protein
MFHIGNRERLYQSPNGTKPLDFVSQRPSCKSTLELNPIVASNRNFTVARVGEFDAADIQRNKTLELRATNFRVGHDPVHYQSLHNASFSKGLDTTPFKGVIDIDKHRLNKYLSNYKPHFTLLHREKDRCIAPTGLSETMKFHNG